MLRDPPGAPSTSAQVALQSPHTARTAEDKRPARGRDLGRKTNCFHRHRNTRSVVCGICLDRARVARVCTACGTPTSPCAARARYPVPSARASDAPSRPPARARRQDPRSPTRRRPSWTRKPALRRATAMGGFARHAGDHIGKRHRTFIFRTHCPKQAVLDLETIKNNRADFLLNFPPVRNWSS